MPKPRLIDDHPRPGMHWHAVANFNGEITMAMNTPSGVLVAHPSGLVHVPGECVAKRWSRSETADGWRWRTITGLVPRGSVHMVDLANDRVAELRAEDRPAWMILNELERWVEIDGPMPEIPEGLLGADASEAGQ